ALEFIEGRSLGAVIAAEGALVEDRALRIARQIADALSAAHAAGIVHRDLKPDNVMLIEREGVTDFAKVLDFGIAKLKPQVAGESQQQLTQLGSVFGTPEYMSPEQARGLEVDGRADLYTLGLIVYEMLSGVSPFRHTELVVVLTRQITEDPPPLPAAVSSETAELVRTLLQKDPAARVQSATALCERLDVLLRRGGTPAAPEANAAPAAPSGPRGASLAVAHTALDLPGARREPLLALRTLLQRLGWKRQVAVAGYAVPLGLLLAMAAVVLVVVVLTGTLLSVALTPNPTGSAAPMLPKDPDVVALMTKAEQGDRSALQALAERSPDERSPGEWRVLAHAHCENAEPALCLAVYAQALTAFPQLAQDATLLGDVRRLTRSKGIELQALDLAARSMGAAGADLLYAVAEEGRGAASPEGKRARALLDEEPARSQLSPALRSLLKLQAALKKPKCGELKALLPELARDADARAAPGLTRLADRRGCGFLGLSDCFGCLRASKDLANTLQAVRARPAPSFAEPRPAPTGSPAKAPNAAPARSSSPSPATLHKP
ncbi:MAG TPA: serine/threonine-protein kinase, partial [Polyangiaceae bacterium]|nr:serine/threonine-protein kinase [Polyangiaceae bacterium]